MVLELPEDVRRWMLTALDHTLLITDRDLNVVGDPVTVWTRLDLTLKFNEPGHGSFVVPGYPWIRDQLNAGCRIVAIRNRQVVMAGPFEQSLYERSDDGENAGVGVLTVDFSDDLASICGRLAHADPALDADSQTTDNWQYVGNAELALRELVNLNAGPGALAARRVPHLVLGTLAGVGSSITLKTERFETLGAAMRRAAFAGGGLGFRTTQVDDEIHFQVYDPPDQSDSVRFSVGLGNLRYVGYEWAAPKVTTVYVGGQGEGADRRVIERTDAGQEAAWGRIEQLLARPGNAATAELEEDGDKALSEDGESVRLATSAVDTPDQRYGIHYGLGDRVAVEPWQGAQVTDLVLTVHIAVYPTAGEVVTTTIGSQASSTESAYVRSLRALEDRLGRLERVVTPAVMFPSDPVP